ncbi:unnamed protein product [Cylindrotheca closterium]|uniref:Uncharacterized protein n=1 Tax=Cylindrotheca closterium TaxID=2856 RepID=A0AAD2FVC3_9STRA|nr:unnamed protein product [Cylindrotheca closterium]
MDASGASNRRYMMGDGDGNEINLRDGPNDDAALEVDPMSSNNDPMARLFLSILNADNTITSTNHYHDHAIPPRANMSLPGPLVLEDLCPLHFHSKQEQKNHLLSILDEAIAVVEEEDCFLVPGGAPSSAHSPTTTSDEPKQ